MDYHINRLFFRSNTALLLQLLLLLRLLFGTSHAAITVLLDSTTQSSLDWTKYPFGYTQGKTPGWVEESFTNFQQGINWRSYVVCDVAYQNVNNWLWTPFIPRGRANQLHIEVKFSMRDCSLFPGNALSCKETFSILYSEVSAEGGKEPPPWEPESYKLIDRIAADEGRSTFNSEVIINTEKRHVPVSQKGVYFAFRDQGACLSLIAIKVYYVNCPNVTVNLARFVETPTGREPTEIVPAEGTCVENAVQVDTPRLLCKGDGNWTLPSGGCKCMAGYQQLGQTCQVCPVGTYKATMGDDSCLPCPARSNASFRGSIECRCETGFYRADKDARSAPCTQPPSAPISLSVGYVDQNVVMLTWQPPKNNGGRNDTVYRVNCDLCVGVTYAPAQFMLNQTKVTISGLAASTTYTIQVYAENGVSGKGLSQYAEVKITTEASGFVSMVVAEDGRASSPPLIAGPGAGGLLNPRVLAVGVSEITVGWQLPDNSVEIPRCEVRYVESANASDLYSIGQSSFVEVLQTLKDELTVANLKPRVEYVFQIRCLTHTGWTDYSRPLLQSTAVQWPPASAPQATSYAGNAIPGKPEQPLVAGRHPRPGAQVRIIAGVSVAAVVALLVALVMILVYLRRSSDECSKKQPSDCDTLEYTRNGETIMSSMEHPPIVPTVRSLDLINSPFSVTTLLFPHCGSTRSYVDPHTYEDPNQAIREFTREIEANHIQIEAIIGGGEFGDVCRGKLLTAGRGELTVAIKTLKPGAVDKARMDFLTEASIMGQFDHPNVIYLQGVVTKSNPIMIITEYMDNGSLDAFLRANHGKFQILQLLSMMRGVACGMQYLSDINYVHRDLAARNVLVNAALVCKIADFGLSREIESANEGAYTTRGGKIPVRWTAPEAIAFRKFTSSSDVWSFGIVAWEVLSYGERPYWNWSNQDVIKGIEKGYRLPPPVDCPQALHQLMLDCWQKDRSMRPTFAQIVKTLDKLIKNPEYLHQLAWTPYQ